MFTLDALLEPRTSIYVMYYKIALTHADRYHALAHELTNLETQGDMDEQLATYVEGKKVAIISITFAGMSLEAFFYDYAAQTLGDEFVQEHLDKLSLKSKLLIYPKLVWGQEINKLSIAYKEIADLVS